MHTRYLPCLALALSVVACDAGDDTDLASVEGGVYEISHWTRNDDTCAAEGLSVLAERPASHVVIGHVQSDYESFIVVQPCSDEQTCGDAFDEVVNGGWSFAELLEGNIDDGFDARTAGTTLRVGENTCRAWVENATLTTQTGVAHFERRTRYVEEPHNGGLFCRLSNGHPGDGAPCREFEVITATRVAPLPQ